MCHARRMRHLIRLLGVSLCSMRGVNKRLSRQCSTVRQLIETTSKCRKAIVQNLSWRTASGGHTWHASKQHSCGRCQLCVRASPWRLP